MDSKEDAVDEYHVVCRDCAVGYGGRLKRGEVRWFHADICDVCNRWQPVTYTRDYGYPTLPYKRDVEKIRKSLQRAIETYQKDGSQLAVYELQNRLEDLKD